MKKKTKVAIAHALLTKVIMSAGKDIQGSSPVWTLYSEIRENGHKALVKVSVMGWVPWGSVRVTYDAEKSGWNNRMFDSGTMYWCYGLRRLALRTIKQIQQEERVRKEAEEHRIASEAMAKIGINIPKE